ncbi:MAG: aspartyl/asparaginyl beta-hydroxylase domain-containing protein [Acidobacteriota bacterium]
MTQPEPTIFTFQGPDDGTVPTDLGEGIGTLVRAVKASIPELSSSKWISAPLVNSSGGVDDHDLEGTGGTATPYLEHLPFAAECVEHLRSLGMESAHVRLLTLDPGGIFWPHLDSHAYLRFLMPIEAQDDSSLYLFDDRFYLCDLGRYYYLQPDICHAAFNVSDQRRSVLCFDVLTSRKCVESMLRLATVPEPMAGRLPLSRRLETMIAEMFAQRVETDPDGAGILAFLLGHGMAEASTAGLYRRLAEGLTESLGSDPEAAARNNLENTLHLLRSHPYFPRTETDGAAADASGGDGEGGEQG